MRLKTYRAATLACALIILPAALAAQNVTGDGDNKHAKSDFASDAIIITGKRYESSVIKEGKAVTVITEDEIKNSGKDDLTGILDSVPGITVTRDGTDAGTANVFIRGSKSGNVLIMIDGVKINDPAGTGKNVDLSLIKTVNIERIEIVEGSMSSLYGAEASGGVINIITKRGRGNSVSLEFTGGMYNSFSQSVSLSESHDKGSFFFSGARYSSGGISAAKDMTGQGGFDDDSVESYVVSCKMTGELWDRTSLMFNMNYYDKEMDIDVGAGTDDPNDRVSNRLFSTAGEFRHSPVKWWNYKTGISFMSLDRVYSSPDNLPANKSASTFQGSGIQGTFLNNFIIPVIGTLSIGAEGMNETANTTSANYNWITSATEISYIRDRSVTTLGFYVHDAFSFRDMLFLNAGARIDNHDEFGNHFTWDASGAFVIPVTKTKIRGSAGSGFKSPSLYELYDSTYGNPDLKPEKSLVYDCGIFQEIAFSGNVISFEGTYFYQEYTDMLSYDPATFVSANIKGKMADRGFELAASLKMRDTMSLGYTCTFLDFLENTDNKRFLKRPEHKHSMVLTLTPLTGLVLNISYLYTGERWGTQTIRLDPYHKIDANIRYAFNETMTITLRGENLNNTDYMDTYGYNTYGRSFFGGVELTF